MQKGNGICGSLEQDICKGACEKKENAVDYNTRVNQAIDAMNAKPSFVIVEESFDRKEQACILIKGGKFYGMGNIPLDKNPVDCLVLKNYIKPYRENSFTRNLVHSYAFKYPAKVMTLCEPVNLHIEPSHHYNAASTKSLSLF